MAKPAISFMVPPRLWNDFKVQTDGLFLSRAPFLNYMLKRELVYVREDLAGTALTTRTKRYISGELKRQGPNTSVNIEVEPETADALRAAVAEHNLVRDALMCRLIIFLRSTDALLKYLEVPRVAGDQWLGSGLEEMPASPLGAMEAVRDDPLFYIRHSVERTHQCGIYRVHLPVTWAACYLEDELVPGTRAYRKRQKESEAFTALLADAPPYKSRRTGGKK